MRNINTSNKNGFVLITALLLISLLLTLLATYYKTTFLEISASGDSAAAADGFYAAEAGLNIKADSVRSIFSNYNNLTGTPPSDTAPCTGSNMGSGDYACQNFVFNGRNVRLYMSPTQPPPGVSWTYPLTRTIPLGEPFQGLSGSERSFTARSTAFNSKNNQIEADLELRFKTRSVPLFQFAYFFNKDAEILPGETMNLSGPIHANGDVYLNSSGSVLTVNGQITTVKEIYRGRKDTNTCTSNSVKVYNPGTATLLKPSCSTRVALTNSDMTPFNGMLKNHLQPISVPDPGVLNPNSSSIYWQRADLRMVLKLSSSESLQEIQVQNLDGSKNNAFTTAITGGTCSSSTLQYKTFWNLRENKLMKILDVDMNLLLNCLKASSWFSTGKTLDETSDGGLVFYATVLGPNSSSNSNSYGIRLLNGSELKGTYSGSSTKPRGLTFATDQAIYVKGNYNVTNKIPASILSDSFNVFSGNWNDANCVGSNTSESSGNCKLSARNAQSTTINAAMLAGTDTTGGIDGSSGQGGAYSGGAHNFTRLMENWTGDTLTIRGSFVSLGKPKHANGAWVQEPYYSIPNRNFDYDTSFNDPSNLPPLTLRFVYLLQQLFVRDF